MSEDFAYRLVMVICGVLIVAGLGTAVLGVVELWIKGPSLAAVALTVLVLLVFVLLAAVASLDRSYRRP